MRRSARRGCREIVRRLAEDFRARNASGLTKRTSEADQDFISRTLFNSTGRVSKQLGIHYEFLTMLADFLIKSLEEDYPHLSPSRCRPQLLKCMDDGFADLARKVPGWLSESQLLGDDMLGSFDQSITCERKKVKMNIANACTLWEERWKAKRGWYRDPRWVTIAVSILALIIGSFVAPLILRRIPPKVESGAKEMEARRDIQALSVLPVEPVELKAAMTSAIGALTDADLAKAQAVLKTLDPTGEIPTDLRGVQRRLQSHVREAGDTNAIQAVAKAFQSQGLIP